MARGWRRAGLIVASALCAASLSCGSQATAPSTTTPPATTPPGSTPATPKRVLVVTHTTGFRHSSISVAESTIQSLGSTNAIFETRFCRTQADVDSMLTAQGLSDVDAVFFIFRG